MGLFKSYCMHSDLYYAIKTYAGCSYVFATSLVDLVVVVVVVVVVGFRSKFIIHVGPIMTLVAGGQSVTSNGRSVSLPSPSPSLPSLPLYVSPTPTSSPLPPSHLP